MRAKSNTSKIDVKIVFFGTPFFAAKCLEYLLDHNVDIAAVVTQPDRPRGRSLEVSPEAVKALILEKAPHTPLFQPEKGSNADFLAKIALLKPDLFVVVVFGQILPQKLLDIPRLGAINVHPSLLPKFRGAAPIRRCLMAGEQQTGVVIQKMVFQMDAGDVIDGVQLPIPPDMNHGALEEKLLELSKGLLLKVIQKCEKGILEGKKQDPNEVTFAPKLSPEELEVHWEWPAQKFHNWVRALSPKPAGWCWYMSGKEKKRVKIIRTRVVQGVGRPGERLNGDGVFACGEGALQLIEVQPEGKKRMGALDWLRGCPINSQIFIV